MAIYRLAPLTQFLQSGFAGTDAENADVSAVSTRLSVQMGKRRK